MPSIANRRHRLPVIVRRVVLQHERRRGAKPREDELHTGLVPENTNRPPLPSRIADQASIDGHHAGRVAVGQEKAGVDCRDRLVTLGDARDRFDAHDFVVGERRLEIHFRGIEPQHPDRNRTFRVDERRAVEVVQKHAGRDVTGFREIELLGAGRDRTEGGTKSSSVHARHATSANDARCADCPSMRLFYAIGLSSRPAD